MELNNKIMEERSREQYNYGCLMVNFDIPDWDKWVSGMVDPKDVFNNDKNEFGMENEPHTTILYGFNSSINHEHIMQYLMPSHFIKVSFNDMSIFESDNYEVLKFGCTSPALTSLHNSTKHYFDNNWEWPDYSPHVTIAYLKKGTGKKYIQKLPTPFELVPSGYVYSYATGEKFEFDVPVIDGMNESSVVL